MARRGPDHRRIGRGPARRLAECRVEESNILAGERLWDIVEVPGPGQSLVIRSTRRPGGFLDCSLDSDAGTVTCRPGPAVDSAPLTFQLAERRADLPCALKQFIVLILDELDSIEQW